MKTRNSFILSGMAAFAILFSACKKEEIKDEPKTGSVNVKIQHVWGMMETPFALNTALIHPMNNDTMTFTSFRYYISNFKLKKSDGTWWTHPESYFLVDLSTSSSSTLNLSGVPEGEYTEIEYVMGVDSLRNVSGAQTGALSTSNDMFWSWNTGYVMLKAEGTSPQSSNGTFSFHLGGFSGVNSIVTYKLATFGDNSLIITSNKTAEVQLKANPAKLFHADPLSSGSVVHMPGAKAKQMATNFYGGISFVTLID